jgi:molybdenum cofactor cytidylyltransferase
MRSELLFGSVVLAGGRSSRMGSGKSLLRLGDSTAMERIVSSLKTAGVENTVVVTGHQPKQVQLEAERLGVCWTHNAAYDRGMFSSVQAGVGALNPDVQAFFVLPVDYPLVTAGTLQLILAAYDPVAQPVIHPVCLGRRGHPPLIPGRLRPLLESAAKDGNLKDLLEIREYTTLPVDDLAVLLDMDTPDDFQRLSLIARLMDVEDPDDAEHLMSSDDAGGLLEAVRVPPQVIRHSQTVALVAEALAASLNSVGLCLDCNLISRASLLHDIAKGAPRHAEVGARLLRGIGLRRTADIVAKHMAMPEPEWRRPGIGEAEVVFLADKLVIEDQVVTLTEKTHKALKVHAGSEAALRGVARRMQAAETISRKVETAAGRSPDEILRSSASRPR